MKSTRAVLEMYSLRMYRVQRSRGCSSVVERHVANVNVEGSTPFTRFRQFFFDPIFDPAVTITYQLAPERFAPYRSQM